MAGASFARAATPDDCQALRKHGHNDQAKACFESLTQSREPAVRAEGFWGLEMYQDANNEFRQAVDAVAHERQLPRALGPPDARALQQ